MGKVVKFDLKAAPKFAFKKAKTRKKSSTENSNQLDLFNSKHEGKVLKLPSNLAIFDEALLFDEQGNDKAEELYWDAISKGESVSDAYCNLGILQFNTGNKAKNACLVMTNGTPKADFYKFFKNIKPKYLLN